MGRYIKKTGQTTPVNAVVENTWSGSTVNAPSVAMVQDALVGENMLINSDFRHGAINQKGQTSYTTLNQYGVDMWLLRSNSSVKLDVQSDSVKISATTNMIQFVELESGEKYHISAYFNNQLHELDFIAGSTTATENEYLTSYHDSDKQKQVIGIREGVEKTIQYVKLEKGTRFTGMPVWNEALELLKCQRCFEVKWFAGFALAGTFKQLFLSESASYYFVGDPSYVEKREVPTITFKSVNSNDDDITGQYTVKALNISKTSFDTAQLNTECNRPYLKFLCWIDAYQY